MRNIRNNNGPLLVTVHVIIVTLLLTLSSLISADILELETTPTNNALDCSKAVQLVIDYRHLDFIYSYYAAEEYLENYFNEHAGDTKNFDNLKDFVYLHSRTSDHPNKVQDTQLGDVCDIDDVNDQGISEDLFVWLM